jgi:DNA-binding IclR family transcriptional regulator
VPAETTRKRQIPDHAAIVLEVIADFGNRMILKNELELRAHQRGLNGRDVGQAIQAFHRRGWVEHDGSKFAITEAAFEIAQRGPPTRQPLRRVRQSRIPNLFG